MEEISTLQIPAGERRNFEPRGSFYPKMLEKDKNARNADFLRKRVADKNQLFF